MSRVLEDIWLPEVEKEYEDLFKVSRDVGCDVGDQFSEFMALVEDWDERAWKSIEPIGSAYLYGRYGRYATMFFAVGARQAAVVKWMQTGSEHQQSQGRQEAKKRALRLFP